MFDILLPFFWGGAFSLITWHICLHLYGINAMRVYSCGYGSVSLSVPKGLHHTVLSGFDGFSNHNVLHSTLQEHSKMPDWKAHGSKICQTENQMHHEMICFEPHHEPASPVSWASHTSQKHDCCQPPRVGRPLPQLERKGWRCTHSCVAVQCEALNPFGIENYE